MASITEFVPSEKKTRTGATGPLANSRTGSPTWACAGAEKIARSMAGAARTGPAPRTISRRVSAPARPA